MPERPWPDIRAVDETADPATTYTYKVWVEAADGTVLGYAGPVTVEPAG